MTPMEGNVDEYPKKMRRFVYGDTKDERGTRWDRKGEERGPMTEPILAAEVLAEAWVVREAVASSLDALVPEAMVALLALYEKEVAALLALFPEGDVVIRRDGSVAGLGRKAVLCDDGSVIVPGENGHADFMEGDDVLYGLVPLSREADR